MNHKNKKIKWYLYGELDKFHCVEEYELTSTKEQALVSFRNRYPTAFNIVCKKSLNQGQSA